ncbi:MAG TPA: hypothetical protein VM934_00190 [Pyrinomonadaceae bacterium]|jgi:hypothetical protein|nr:hypothetical protein [Pyrinomonadaceae bacterium]
MESRQHSGDAEILRELSAVIRRYPAAAIGETTVEEVARRWLDAGFEDAEEVEDWLRARCFTADGAQQLENAGITPQQAGINTSAGSGNYEDTLGYKLIKGDLGFDEARRIITSEFWDS